MKPIPKVKPRQIDKEALLDILRQEAILKIEREHARRKGRVDTNPLPNPNRQLGQRDITDIPQDIPYQKLVYEKLGGTIIPYGTHYTCPKCGARYLRAFPPKVCKYCGLETVLGRLLKQRGMRR